MEQTLYQTLKNKGYNFFVGVPSSDLGSFIEEIQQDPANTYVPAPKEDTALAVAVGAYLAGKKPIVFLQSSGFPHIINGITTLLKPYNIPIDIVIGLRKHPFEHEFLYKVFYKLVDDLEYREHIVSVVEKE